MATVMRGLAWRCNNVVEDPPVAAACTESERDVYRASHEVHSAALSERCDAGNGGGSSLGSDGVEVQGRWVECLSKDIPV
jgi:hypothetical protein